MTGTIDATAGGTEPQRGLAGFTGTAGPTALIEQAKGVLIFRYCISAEAGDSLLELWAAQTDATVDCLSRTIVHNVCQGDHTVPGDPALVRWVEDRLRHQFPGVECEGVAEPSADGD